MRATTTSDPSRAQRVLAGPTDPRGPGAASLEEVARLVEEHSRKDGFERRCKIGDAVIHGLFGGSRLAWRAQGCVRSPSFRSLAAMLDGRVSKSELHRAVSVHFLCRDLTFVPTSGHLTVSHADAVEGLSRTEQESLLRRAEEERWPVLRLREEKRRVIDARQRAGGRKPLGRPRASAVAALGRDALRTLSEMRRLLHPVDASPMAPDELTQLARLVSRLSEECAALSERVTERSPGPPSHIGMPCGGTSTPPRASDAPS